MEKVREIGLVQRGEAVDFSIEGFVGGGGGGVDHGNNVSRYDFTGKDFFEFLLFFSCPCKQTACQAGVSGIHFPCQT